MRRGRDDEVHAVYVNAKVPELDGGMSTADDVGGSDRVSSTVNVTGGRGETDADGGPCTVKVSAKEYDNNVRCTELRLGDGVCGPGDDDVWRQELCAGDASTHDEGGDEGLVQREGDDDGDVYSNVQQTGDEKVERVQKWSMKTGQLPRIDQNQTRRVSCSDVSGQIVRQNLQRQILLWEGRLQRDILTEDITRNDQYRRPCGRTEEQQQQGG